MKKINPKYKKYIRPFLAVIIFTLGSIFMLVPFIPLGYILIFVGLFLLAPDIPIVKRWINKLKKKDDKNRVDKVERKVKESENKINRMIIDERRGK